MQQTIKVLHISTARGWRGGERQIANLLKGLRKGQYDIENLVLCVQGEHFAAYCNEQQIRNFTYDKKSGLSLTAAKKLKTLCLENQIDIVHCHDSHAHSMAVLSAFLFRNHSKMIVHRRVDFPIKGQTSKWKYNAKSIDAFIAISKEIEQGLRKSIRKPERIHLIYSTVDIETIERVKPVNIYAELNLDRNKKIIGNISALSKEKDYPTFLRTAKRLLSKSNDYEFVIVGSGELRELLEGLATELNIEDQVHFMGYKTNAIAWLKAFDVFLMTSKTEGLGTSVLEAFAAQVPVVGTNAGGMKETILHQHTGLVANIGDDQRLAQNIELLLRDAELNYQLIKNAELFVKESFSIDTMAYKTAKLYRKIISTD